MYAVLVTIQVKPEAVAAFVAASRDNAAGSRREPGCRRWDLVAADGDPTRFALVELYDDQAAFAAHQLTAHYLRWKAAVADLMAGPRTSIKGTVVD